MNSKCRTCRIFAAIALIMMISISMAEKYLVIPTASQTATTCDGPDEVVSGGGRCWKDRNLGATRVATSLTDSLAYGDLYQWGRKGDGHQNRTSPTISPTIPNAYDVPGYRYFILSTSLPYDWRQPQNDNLWQGLGGISNPCPQGFRIPTRAEWEAEIASWSSEDATGAFASPLKLVRAGVRSYRYGDILREGLDGSYWSSDISGDYSYQLYFSSTNAFLTNYFRGYGYSVRCVKD